jgi:hypothetical protein
MVAVADIFWMVLNVAFRIHVRCQTSNLVCTQAPFSSSPSPSSTPKIDLPKRPRPTKASGTRPVIAGSCPRAGAPVAPHARARVQQHRPWAALPRCRAQERRARRCVQFILRVAFVPLVFAWIGRRSSDRRRRGVQGEDCVQRAARRVVVVLCAEDLVQPQRDGVARLCLHRRRCPCVGASGRRQRGGRGRAYLCACMRASWVWRPSCLHCVVPVLGARVDSMQYTKRLGLVHTLRRRS